NPKKHFIRNGPEGAARKDRQAGAGTPAGAEAVQELTWQAAGGREVGLVYLVQGKLAAAEAQFRRSMALNEQRGVPGNYFENAFSLAVIDVFFRNAPEAARREVEAALRRYPFATMPAADRPYSGLAFLYGHMGQPDRAKQVMAEYEAAVPEAIRRRQPFRHGAAAAIALAEGRVQDGIKGYRAWYDEDNCSVCGLYLVARAYERAGERDSALAVYERAVTTPGYSRSF